MPLDAERRLKEARRALKQLHKRREEPKTLLEIFDASCPFKPDWQRSVLSKLIKANIVTKYPNTEGLFMEATYLLLPEASIQPFFDDASLLSRLLWPGAQFEANFPDTDSLEDLTFDEVEEETKSLEASPTIEVLLHPGAFDRIDSTAGHYFFSFFTVSPGFRSRDMVTSKDLIPY